MSTNCLHFFQDFYKLFKLFFEKNWWVYIPILSIYFKFRSSIRINCQIYLFFQFVSLSQVPLVYNIMSVSYKLFMIYMHNVQAMTLWFNGLGDQGRVQRHRLLRIVEVCHGCVKILCEKSAPWLFLVIALPRPSYWT
jgi:hypothetical protein